MDPVTATSVAFKILDVALPSLARVMDLIRHVQSGGELNTEQIAFLEQQQDYWENQFDATMLRRSDPTLPPPTPDVQPNARGEQTQTVQASPVEGITPPPAAPAVQAPKPHRKASVTHAPKPRKHDEPDDDPGVGDKADDKADET